MRKKGESHGPGMSVASIKDVPGGLAQENCAQLQNSCQDFSAKFQGVAHCEGFCAKNVVPENTGQNATEVAHLRGYHKKRPAGSVLDSQVSVFNGITPLPRAKKRLRNVLETIKSEGLQKRIAWVREVKSDPSEYRKRKQNLPGVTFGGVFTKRSNAKIILPFGIIVADIDHLDGLEEVFNLLTQDPFVVFAFRSPGGDGLKVGIHADEVKTDQDHKRLFKGIEKYFGDIYKIRIDPACKDISRLTFLSCDPDLHANLAPLPFPVGEWTTEVHQPTPALSRLEPITPKILCHTEKTGENGFAEVVLHSACERIRNSAPTQQHHTFTSQGKKGTEAVDGQLRQLACQKLVRADQSAWKLWQTHAA